MKSKEEIIHEHYNSAYEHTNPGRLFPIMPEEWVLNAIDEYADQVKPKWISGRFYVVENSQHEEGMINQLSNGFEAFEDAVKFLNSDYNKAWHPKSFIMNSVTPLPEKLEL